MAYWQRNGPALSVTLHTTQRFCDWLTQQTGHAFRLPSEAEWEHALRLGGNDPSSTTPPDRLADIAVTFDDFDPLPVGSKQPNALGLYDMLGNAAEWVTTPNGERVVRGGSYFDDDVCGAWRRVETPDWNAGYPDLPPSRWWYVDAAFVGMRLVIDPATVATP